MTVAGCLFTGGVPQWSGNGFNGKALLDYDRVAVLPFQGDPEGEASDTFAENFREKFSQIELVKRGRFWRFFKSKTCIRTG
jgi:hypothetical protein